MSKETAKIDLSEAETEKLEQQVVSDSCYSNTYSQYLNKEGNCSTSLPNYKSDRGALSLSYGSQSSMYTHSIFRECIMVSDGLPTLSDLISTCDKPQSKYSFASTRLLMRLQRT